jgi:hypothetical protein
MRLPVLLAGAVVLVAVLAQPGHAQDEARLRKALEGKRLTLKMDMPATSEGVDVFPGTNRPVDYEKVGKRTKKEGVAIKDGEAARITRVKVKDDVIEVQLNGGGYGTFGDQFNNWAGTEGADSGTAQQAKRQNDRTEKLAGGSRFNLRYPNGVDPDDLTPAAVAGALEEYASFPPGIATPAVSQASYAAAPAASAPPSSPAAPEQVRKGMSSADVVGIAGVPTSSTTNGPVTTSRYRSASGTLEVDFVNDVAVGVRQLAAGTGGSLRKGLSVAEVEQLAGKPTATTPNGQMLTNKYNWQDGVLEADFFNGVLVGYRTSSK